MATSLLLICIETEGADDLQVLKVYRSIGDPEAESHAMVRVVDDSGEDYLYPRAFFLDLPLPEALERRLTYVAEACRSGS